MEPFVGRIDRALASVSKSRPLCMLDENGDKVGDFNKAVRVVLEDNTSLVVDDLTVDQEVGMRRVGERWRKQGMFYELLERGPYNYTAAEPIDGVVYETYAYADDNGASYVLESTTGKPLIGLVVECAGNTFGFDRETVLGKEPNHMQCITDKPGRLYFIITNLTDQDIKLDIYKGAQTAKRMNRINVIEAYSSYTVSSDTTEEERELLLEEDPDTSASGLESKDLAEFVIDAQGLLKEVFVGATWKPKDCFVLSQDERPEDEVDLLMSSVQIAGIPNNSGAIFKKSKAARITHGEKKVVKSVKYTKQFNDKEWAMRTKLSVAICKDMEFASRVHKAVVESWCELARVVDNRPEPTIYDEKKCAVCWGEDTDRVILLRCGHKCVCKTCCEQLSGNCPLCRASIVSFK